MEIVDALGCLSVGNHCSLDGCCHTHYRKSIEESTVGGRKKKQLSETGIGNQIHQTGERRRKTGHTRKQIQFSY
jgi:hypothetical protein